MECETVEECFSLFNEICITNDTSDSENDKCTKFSSIFGKPVPCPPPEPRTTKRILDFKKYVEEKCENKIKILDRDKFHQIRRPIMICFNHFREKCFYLTTYLDRLHHVASKYGDKIEMIVADLIDIDVIYPNKNPLSSFCSLVRPEKESLYTFVIDEKKQIHQHFDAYQTVATLSEVCDQLLNGSLYISLPLPCESDSRIKTAVHLNYDELVTRSKKDILLIVGLGDYHKSGEFEPNYEQISVKFEDSNVEIVYIDGDKNYVPFNLNAFCYPTIVFIPHNDKENFIHFSNHPRNTEAVMGFIEKNIAPHAETVRRNEIVAKRYKPFALPKNYELEFKDLHDYMKENYCKSFKVFERTTFNYLKHSVLERTAFNYLKHSVIIYFMDIKEKGLAFYLKTLQKIHQVAEAKHHYGVHFVVADIKDIDIMYPEWYKQYLSDPQLYLHMPKVFGIDRMKCAIEVDNLETASSLCYFYFDLTYSHFYFSQPWRMSLNNDLVTTCVADNLKILCHKSKTDIFLTIFRLNYKESSKILKVLDEIANDVKEQKVQMFKMDAQHNYVPLEYTYPIYPVHFFIPCSGKEIRTIRFINSHQSKEEILDFIQKNLQNK